MIDNDQFDNNFKSGRVSHGDFFSTNMTGKPEQRANDDPLDGIWAIRCWWKMS